MESTITYIYPRAKFEWGRAHVRPITDRLPRSTISHEATDRAVDSKHISKDTIRAKDGPKRKQTIFVQEEELKSMLEARAGTPHISELHFDDDEVQSRMNVEELGLAGAAEVIGEVKT
ncbi:hypothetical protein EK21DRAFT_114346 [Setomelanomma holmii]|uniref:Uncharacterized protein n=1 Tax=Setomelanomma holmii TaxID=210430 RepID=A0A9P4H6A3_9PLEO|nr:hypothetical protein EK21DRAFT_114346 [Setomelanomma holmii]